MKRKDKGSGRNQGKKTDLYHFEQYIDQANCGLIK